jgi:hypothetical protein
MMYFFDRVKSGLAKIAAARDRFRARRSERAAASKQEIFEAERIDRLRNPSYYRGR